MKKRITLMLLALLCMLLPISSVAADDIPIEDVVPVVFSEDYTTLTLDGVGYSRVNPEPLSNDLYDLTFVYADYMLTEAQQAVVDRIDMTQYGDHTILIADIYFKDGAVLTVNFLRDDLRAEFDLLVSGQTDTYVIDFRWPGDNTVTTERETLFGKEVTLSKSTLENGDDFYVDAQSKNGFLTVTRGFLLADGTAFYYVDCEKSGIESDNFYSFEYTELTAWEITDPDLLERLTEAKRLYDDDISLFGGDLTILFGYTGLIVLFVLLPLAAAVLGWILFARSKKPIYKKICLTVALLATAELIVAVLVCICRWIP